MMCLLSGRYNCNRYDEEEAKRARDAQEVTDLVIYFYCRAKQVNFD